jgi:Rieske Fe-S protein
MVSGHRNALNLAFFVKAWCENLKKGLILQTENQEFAADNLTRRRMLANWLWGLVAAIAALELSWITGSIFKSHKKKDALNKGATIIEAGQVSQFSPGQVKAVPQGQFYLACLENGSFIALSRTCTHLGCSVPWNEDQGKFICPCHGSTFDQKGLVLTPPAIRPLDYYPLRIENGTIRVDVSSPLKRQGFEDSQTGTA